MAESHQKLSDLQYSFRSGLGTIKQSLNLNIFIGKYVKMRKVMPILAFGDLSSAFDCVIHEKHWSKLKDIGVDIPIISFLRDLHTGCRAKVRIGAKGECTEAFGMARVVRQGYVLAPFPFSLYINSVGDVLVAVAKDLPQIGTRPVPALL